MLTSFAGTRILLAEDEPINREIAMIVLSDVGLLVDSAEDVRAAVRPDVPPATVASFKSIASFRVAS